MDWNLPFHAVCDGNPVEPGIPLRLLRHLFLGRGIAAGSRVLDVGCGDGSLTRFLHQLSINTVGIDSSAERIALARQSAPGLEYYCATPEGPLPLPDHQVDFVVVRDMASYRGGLLESRALLTTASLLATLRPGGELVMIARMEPDWNTQPGGHLRSCFARHMGCFSHVCKVSYLADPLFARTTWRWMLGQQPRSGFMTASVRVQDEAVSRSGWLAIAARELHRSQAACCRWASTDDVAGRIEGTTRRLRVA